MTAEKNIDMLPTTQATANTSTTAQRNFGKRAGILLALISVVTLFHGSRNGSGTPCTFKGLTNAVDFQKSTADMCPQAATLVPSQHREVWETSGKAYSSVDFKSRAVEWLGGAVRIPTESYDKMDPVGVDPRWEAFGTFHDYLLHAFPLVHSALELTKVNTYGLLYHWKGSDTSLKPLLLAAHQDVVPVDPKTIDEWEHPPYSGHYDGERRSQRLWGRGSSDDKSGLIGILTGIETLLEKGFQPARSVVLAFGFDEETSGLHGAAKLSEVLLAKFGEGAFAMIVDEGGGFGNQYGGVFAVPAVAEKGYIDVRVEVSSPGGHSSIPPEHTSIGMLSALLVQYEAHPYKVRLERGTPIYNTIQCFGAHAPDIPKSLRRAIRKSAHSNHALRAVEEDIFKNKMFKSFVGTTQAIDLIQGGVKTNALPEQAWAVVNHRIATQSSVDAVKARDTALLEKLASQFNLTYDAFGKTVHGHDGPAYGTLTLTDAWGTALEPAPITPSGADAAPFQLLSGTIKGTYNAHRSFQNEEEIYIAPGIMSGNTDTRYYWRLSEHIFRYNHHNQGDTTRLPGVHTVNESIDMDAFVEMVRFFTTLILNADESRML